MLFKNSTFDLKRYQGVFGVRSSAETVSKVTKKTTLKDNCYLFVKSYIS